ncbi:RICIN domain-containing protein [Acetivibrio thermocellus]|uniref:RICIN domain-containing protein n=1 Tax=Acetivibrio thermocellus TaxID=1515 RepID=UPI0021AD87BA|nr:RICIN domain-containing protein [Acetivibrio thermocellus]UWV45590.1 RICIN domain-containing protein [Acetivibrio thermocellus]
MVKKNVGLRFLSILILMALLIGNVQSFNVAAAEGVIVNGTQFKDTSGNVIHAHGGGMLKHGDYYYWYGEYRDDSNLFLGVSCYRSKDLVNWEYRGEVLSRNSAPELNRCNIERPKVMYNASTGEFVMWMHWENGINYGQARAAVAYSKTPDGKFTYIRSFRPMQDTGVMDHGLPGYMSRDCNVFVDTDGKGYFISAANENMDLHLYELTPDYKNIASLKAKLFVGQQREAPCLIKRNGYYYLITSGCTGWNPNQAKYAYSKDLASGWSQLYNLGNSTTYRSQPTFIIPVQGSSGTSYLYMGDRWAGAWGGKVNDSQYVWLPLNFISDTTLELPYYDSVKIDASSGIISEYIPDTTRYKLVNKNSGKVLDVLDGSVDNAAQIVQWTDNGSLSQQWYLVDVGGGYKKIVNVKSGRALDVKDESKEDGGVLIQYTSNGGYNQHWKFTDIGDGYYKISSRHCGKLIDVRKWSTEDGGIIQQWSDAGGTNQHWKLVLVSSPEPSPSPSPQVVKGDVNGDLKVNSTDFSMLRRYLLKIIDNFPTENGKQAADLNGDGRINSSDLTMLKRYLLMEVDL